MTRNASIVTGPQGTIRVYVPGADDAEGRKAARAAACKAHGGVTIGATPKAHKSARGVTYTFTPVTVVKPAPRPAVKPSVRAAVGKRQTELATGDPVAALKSQIDMLAAQLAALTGDPVTVKRERKPREVPPVVKARIDARAAAVAACATCHGHGVVRARGANAGKAYRTADGAKAATANGNSSKCPAKHARKAA